MSCVRRALWVVEIAVAILCLGRTAPRNALLPLSQGAGIANSVTSVSTYGQLPLSFEANQGQVDPEVQFLSRARGGTVFLTSSGAAFSLSSGASSWTPKRSMLDRSDRATEQQPGPSFRMRLVAMESAAQPVGEEELPGKANYFIGNDPAKWRTNIPTFGKLKYSGVYPGVDLIYYGNQRQLEFDFVVQPGADPGAIRLSFDGLDGMEVDDAGDLILRVGGREVIQRRPHIYQEVNGERRDVAGAYVIVSGPQVAFHLEAYDKGRALVIDPVLIYSTYLGGSGDDAAWGIAVDAAGNAYVAGQTLSLNFPTHNPHQAATRGGLDAFVIKLNPAGNALVYSTYLGGAGNDTANGIAVDAAGNASVAGFTNSGNFPTANALQPLYGGNGDAFVVKLNSAGNALIYSTYLGGRESDRANGIAADATGNVYVTGWTGSSLDFPVANPLQQFRGGGSDAFITKLGAAGGLVYSTYLGGTGPDYALGIAVDAAGNAYVTGVTESVNFPTVNPYQVARRGPITAFVTKVNSAGSALVYSTYLGGSTDDEARGIAVDSGGTAYVTGITHSLDFPVFLALQPTPGRIPDAFVTALIPSGTGLAYSTYLGGRNVDMGNGIAVDAVGNVYVTGETDSVDFPAFNALQPTPGGGGDAFVAVLNRFGSEFVYSTYLGGSFGDAAYGIAVGGSAVYIAGRTASTNFPTVNPLQAANAGGYDAFVAKTLPTTQTPSPTLTRIFPPVGPTTGGTQVTLTGTNFVSGASVFLGGVEATDVTVTSSTTITAKTPAHATGSVDVLVRNPDTQTATLPSGFAYAGDTPPPSLSTISPSSGLTTGGTLVTLTGSNFRFGPKVFIGGKEATEVTILSSTTITARTPDHDAGSADVVVVTRDGQMATLPGAYTYRLPEPRVESVDPGFGSFEGGTKVTVYGSNFVPGTKVFIGSREATDFVFISSTKVLSTTPAHWESADDVRRRTQDGGPHDDLKFRDDVAVAVDVKVLNPDGQSHVLERGFRYSTSLGPLGGSGCSHSGFGTPLSLLGLLALLSTRRRRGSRDNPGSHRSCARG